MFVGLRLQCSEFSEKPGLSVGLACRQCDLAVVRHGLLVVGPIGSELVALVEHGIITSQERDGVDRVLNAAALTYVAAAVSTLLTLLYFLWRAGLLGGRR